MHLDLLVDATTRLGPGNAGVIQMRPMTEHVEKVCKAVRKLEAEAHRTHLKLKACQNEAKEAALKGTRFEDYPQDKLDKASDSFLVAAYQKKGRKQR